MPRNFELLLGIEQILSELFSVESFRLKYTIGKVEDSKNGISPLEHRIEFPWFIVSLGASIAIFPLLFQLAKMLAAIGSISCRLVIEISMKFINFFTCRSISSRHTRLHLKLTQDSVNFFSVNGVHFHWNWKFTFFSCEKSPHWFDIPSSNYAL